MRFLKKIIKTSVDFSGHTSALVHSLIGCNLKCYKCHNYKDLVAKQHKKYYSDTDIIEKMKLNGFLFDAIIFSGGEFLLENIEDIKGFLTKLRVVFEGKIIINTNGTFPEKILILAKSDLVDGFHMDIKFDFWNEIDTDVAVKTIGRVVSPIALRNSFNTIKQFDKGNSEFRTVKYPFLSEEYFKGIEKKCELEGVKWVLNGFVDN